MKKILLNTGDLDAETIVIRLVEDETNQKIEGKGEDTDNTGTSGQALAARVTGKAATTRKHAHLTAMQAERIWIADTAGRRVTANPSATRRKEMIRTVAEAEAEGE